MDGHRFDELTKALASGVSRRRALRGLLGGALGGALAAVGARDAAAACPHPLVACPRIGGECVNLRIDPENCGRCARECASEQVCYAGRCMGSCPSGFVACQRTCVRGCPGNQMLNLDTCVCEPLRDVGDSCGAASECLTGDCVQGLCCIEQGQSAFSCGSHGDCCSDLLCNGSGVCVVCIEANESGCTMDGDCCDVDHICDGGECIDYEYCE